MPKQPTLVKSMRSDVVLTNGGGHTTHMIPTETQLLSHTAAHDVIERLVLNDIGVVGAADRHLRLPALNIARLETP
jgi:hypothetical protein